MIALKKPHWLRLAGALWALGGLSLCLKGSGFLSQALAEGKGAISLLGSSREDLSLLASLGIVLGWVKGKFAMRRAVERTVKRIAPLEQVSWKEVFPLSFWILMGGMVALGASLRYLPLPLDIRGALDLAIGTALLYGANRYLIAARA